MNANFDDEGESIYVDNDTINDIMLELGSLITNCISYRGILW